MDIATAMIAKFFMMYCPSTVGIVGETQDADGDGHYAEPTPDGNRTEITEIWNFC